MSGSLVESRFSFSSGGFTTGCQPLVRLPSLPQRRSVYLILAQLCFFSEFSKRCQPHSDRDIYIYIYIEMHKHTYALSQKMFNHTHVFVYRSGRLLSKAD